MRGRALNQIEWNSPPIRILGQYFSNSLTPETVRNAGVTTPSGARNASNVAQDDQLLC
jgi:hypothetical protein